MMEKITVLGLCALLFALSFSAASFIFGQQQIPRIAVINGSSRSGAAPRVDAFRQGLRDLGYIEGKTVEIEYRYADGNLDRLPDLIGELIRLRVDIIATSTDQAISAAQQATKTIPIVFAAQGDPVTAGFVVDLERPGGNITGTTSLSTGTVRKRVELFREAVPGLSHLAVLWNPGSVTHKRQAQEAQASAEILGIKFQSLELGRPEDLDSVFAGIMINRANGLFIFRSPIVRLHARRITEFAEKNRLPTMYDDSVFVEGGGLISYGPDIADLDRRAAGIVDKILRGAKPADLPVEQPTKFEFVINFKTAKQIGLTIPATVLARADRVIR
jgi:putative ABC transport system substrate-binding protein